MQSKVIVARNTSQKYTFYAELVLVVNNAVVNREVGISIWS